MHSLNFSLCLQPDCLKTPKISITVHKSLLTIWKVLYSRSFFYYISMNCFFSYSCFNWRIFSSVWCFGILIKSTLVYLKSCYSLQNLRSSLTSSVQLKSTVLFKRRVMEKMIGSFTCVWLLIVEQANERY